MGLVIRTIGIARATLKIGMANRVYNIKRLICLERAATASQHEPEKAWKVSVRRHSDPKNP